MNRTMRAAGFPARFLMLARETFEVSVAIHYHAPWAHTARDSATVSRNEAA
jgi:hypothetical protein